MTVKELMDFLKECPEDADINVKNYIDSAKYRIEELAGFFDGVKNVVNIYISEERRGHWELSHFKDMFVCSYCRQYYISTDEAYDFNYCPHCGVKMDEVTT